MSSKLATVDFYGDTLEAVKDDKDVVWVSLKRCCENLGVEVQTQSRKLKAKAWATTTQMIVDLSDNSRREVTMIDLVTLPGWLFSIDSRKVKPEVKDKLIRYQRECAKVLADYFLRQSEPPLPAPIATPAQVVTVPAINVDDLATQEQLARVWREMKLETKIAKQMALHGQYVTSQQRARQLGFHELANLFPHIDRVAREIIRQGLGEDVIEYNEVAIYFKPHFRHLDTAINIIRDDYENIIARQHASPFQGY